MKKNQEFKTPIAIFTYNRPHHTRQVLESLFQCKRLDECKLFIYCDGPKHPDQVENVITTQKVVQLYADKMDSEVTIQEKNIGLACSIVSGVTDLCNRFGRAIVIEDDLIVSPSFIDYMLLALDRYSNEERVYQISGFMFPIDCSTHQDSFFLPFTTTWGWATWDRAWKKFDWNASGYQKLLSDRDTRNRFNLDGVYPYYDMLINRFSGKNDSWGILWWYAVFSAGGLILYPSKTLVINRGFDGTGTHCGNLKEYIKITKINELNIYSDVHIIQFPETITVNAQIYTQIKKHLERDRGNIIQTISRILKK